MVSSLSFKQVVVKGTMRILRVSLVLSAFAPSFCRAFSSAPPSLGSVRHPIVFPHHYFSRNVATRPGAATPFLPQRWRRQPLKPLASSLMMDTYLTSIPSCPSASAARIVAIKAGILTMGTQVFLQERFRRSKDPLLMVQPAYRAHSIVAFLLMCLVSVVGIWGWWGSSLIRSTTAAERVLDPFGPARWLAAVIWGSFACWDLPVSIQVSALRKPAVIIHHAVMLVLALFGATILPMRYILYFFGVAELSSIPLIVYDQLSQDKMVLQDTIDMQQKGEEEAPGQSGEEAITESKLHQRLDRVERRRALLEIITAVAFSLVRAVHFAWISLRHFLPDALPVLRSQQTSGILKPLVIGTMLANVGFTLLQWFWFGSMIRTVLSTTTEGVH